MNVHFNNILVATDFSDQSLIALEQSYTLARLIRADITLLHVVAETSHSVFSSIFSSTQSDIIKAKYSEECFQKLDEIAKSAAEKSKISVYPKVDFGKPYERIVELAKEYHARFIVMGTNSQLPTNHKKRFISSNTLRVIREASCPVLTVNGKDFFPGCRYIVLPLDLSKQTKHKVAKAVELAKLYGATIKVVSAILTTDSKIIEQLKVQIAEVKKYINENNVICITEVVNGIKGKDTLASLIIRYAIEADGDLIMIMTQQEVDWVKFFIGSTAQEILNNSKIPVISIRPMKVN